MLKEIPPCDDGDLPSNDVDRPSFDNEDIEAEVEKNVDPDGMIVGRVKNGR